MPLISTLENFERQGRMTGDGRKKQFVTDYERERDETKRTKKERRGFAANTAGHGQHSLACSSSVRHILCAKPKTDLVGLK